MFIILEDVPATSSTDSSPHPTHESFESLIRRHFPQKSDCEIGLLAQPRVSGMTVKKFRLYQLGLKRDHADKKTLIDLVDWKDFERLVLNGGFSYDKYAAETKLGCTGEALRLVAEQKGLAPHSHSHSKEWLAMRKAEELEKPYLADKKWLQTKVMKADSVWRLAEELGIHEDDLYYFMKLFGISRKYVGRKPRKLRPRPSMPAPQISLSL